MAIACLINAMATDPQLVIAMRAVQGLGAGVIPAAIEIDFCKELLGFMNGTANGTRYRIILEDAGYKLEAV